MANDQEDLAINLAEWMTDLPLKLRNLPITQIAIPGTHNSATFHITCSSKLAPDAEDFLVRLSWMRCAITCCVAKWAKTQDFGIKDQLEAGIRFFDFRVSIDKRLDLYIVHGLFSEAVRKCLTGIKEFLDEHTEEIVILDFQHFYSLDQEKHETLISMILNILGNKLSPQISSNLSYLTLEYMKENKQQVIVIYRNALMDPQFFPSDYCPTPWPNTTSTDELITFLSDNLKTRDPEYGYVSQFLLTPGNKTIIRYFYGSLKTFSKSLYKKKFDWIEKQTPGGAGGVNVIIADFVNMYDCTFPKAVINLNKKLLV